MDWMRAVNGYCERTDAGYWSEPVNALTNIAFLVAAAICWRLLGIEEAARGTDWGARGLVGVLALIGVGSFLFHTHARVWAGLADVLPILGFILLYTGLATTRFFGLPPWAGVIAAIAYVPVSACVSALIEGAVGSLNGSGGYLPVVFLIAGYAVALRRRAPGTARGLWIGVAILVVSLTFRTVDEAVCPVFPMGTHFLWHLLNAVMLGWMIRVMLRHRAV